MPLQNQVSLQEGNPKKRRRKKTKESPPSNTVENNGGIIDDTKNTIAGGENTVDFDVNKTSYDNSNIEKPSRMNSMNAHRTNIQNNSKLAQSHNVATQKQQSAMTQLPAQQQQCPPWALQLMNKVREINYKLGKLDDIEKSLNHLNIKVHDLDNKVCAMDSRLTTVEGCCSFISDQFEVQKNEIKNTQDGIMNTKQQCSELERKMNNLKQENVILHDRLTNVETRSMRENLLFNGLSETQGEDCEDVVRIFCKTQLGLTNDFIDKIVFDRAHRLRKPTNDNQRINTGGAAGNPNTNDTRVPPIVVKFHSFKDREKVREQAYTKWDSDSLREMRLNVREQLPYLHLA